MKPAEIRELTDEELEERLTDLHRELRDLRFQEAIGNLTANHQFRQIRKTIARIHTIRTERANQATA